MNVNDLYIEYGKVAQRCKGTPLENKPWECVKAMNICNEVVICREHPNFNSMVHPEYVLIAVAFLDNKPVFRDSVLYDICGRMHSYNSDLNSFFSDVGDSTSSYSLDFITDGKTDLYWHPPEPQEEVDLSPDPIDTDNLPTISYFYSGCIELGQRKFFSGIVTVNSHDNSPNEVFDHVIFQTEAEFEVDNTCINMHTFKRI